jgi:carbonic anhydrase/acetyltransferase-like protein (isoleucine patch superfamily)
MEYNTDNKPTILPFKGIFPDIHPSVFMCAGVRIIGDVTIGADSSVWFNSVIRGDVHYIRIGERTNIQDMCMLHVTNGKFPLNIGNDVVIGHSVNIHGCTLEDRCLIGIGANLLDGCRVSSYSFVAAGALVREGFTVPEGCLVAGVPGKVVRRLKDEEIEMISYISGNYLKYVADYRQNLGNLG